MMLCSDNAEIKLEHIIEEWLNSHFNNEFMIDRHIGQGFIYFKKTFKKYGIIYYLYIDIHTPTIEISTTYDGTEQEEFILALDISDPQCFNKLKRKIDEICDANN